MKKISALIHVENDGRHLSRALETLRCCDEILVVNHNSQRDRKDDAEKVAREYGASFKESIAGVDDGAYALDCQHDWILCVLPSETVSEGLEAAVLEWKHSDGKPAPGYTVSIREQTKEGWRELGRQMRLVNRTCINWTGKLPPTASNSQEISGDLLRFSD